MQVAAGTDTYGRVKVVSGTPIVTKFIMLQFLPIIPLKSFYYLGTGPVQRHGIPLIAFSQTVSINGIPLASVDKTSVLMAYIRGIFAALTLVGCMLMVPGFMYVTGEHINEFAMLLIKVLFLSLCLGVFGGLASYLLPVTSRREREIRQACAELLGIAADPARVSMDAGIMIKKWLDETCPPEESARTHLIRELMQTRLEIIQSKDKHSLENHSDELLDQLRKVDGVALGFEDAVGDLGS